MPKSSQRKKTLTRNKQLRKNKQGKATGKKYEDIRHRRLSDQLIRAHTQRKNEIILKESKGIVDAIANGEKSLNEELLASTMNYEISETTP